MPSAKASIVPHLHKVTLETLNAVSFNRASTSASNVLTDLLSRYLNLLAVTCSQYAQHAGRNGANLHDAVNALEELGVDVEELLDWGKGEGIALERPNDAVLVKDDEKEQLVALRGTPHFGGMLGCADKIHSL